MIINISVPHQGFYEYFICVTCRLAVGFANPETFIGGLFENIRIYAKKKKNTITTRLISVDWELCHLYKPYVS